MTEIKEIKKNNNMICPQCKNESDCEFCENTGEVSEQLEILYLLGFRFKQKYQGQYRIYLQKVLNRIETISVDIVKEDEVLKLAIIDSSGSNNIIQRERLDSVEQVIRFLSKN